MNSDFQPFYEVAVITSDESGDSKETPPVRLDFSVTIPSELYGQFIRKLNAGKVTPEKFGELAVLKAIEKDG